MRTRLAILCFVFYIAHAIALVLDDLPQNVLWSCHVACVLTGVGLLRKSSRLVSIAFLLLALGLPTWVGNVAAGPGDLLWTSILTHFGGLVIAAWGVRQFGMEKGSWWRAAAVMVFLWIFTRLVAPEGAGVNFAYGYFLGWEERYFAYPAYLLTLLGVTTLLLRLLQRLGDRVGR